MTTRPIYSFSREDAHRIYAWARYVFYTEIEHEQYSTHEQAANEPALGRTLVLMMQFYAALWVAVEGWRAIPLSDDTVDELLADPAFEQNVTLLRRFRNGVYHYQPEPENEKVLAFLRDGAEHAVAWAFVLHDEFKRVIWEMTHPGNLSSTLQKELEEVLHDLIGWLPTDLPEAAPHRATERHREIAEMIRKDERRYTPEARQLLDAANQIRVAADDAQAGWRQYKRAMIEALKKQKKAQLGDR